MKGVIILLSVLTVASCGSSKKEVQQHKEQLRYYSEFDSSSTSATKATEQESTALLNQSSEQSRQLEYEGCEGDSLTYTERGPEGNIVFQATFKGSGKGTMASGIKNQSAAATSNKNISVQNSATASGTAAASGEAFSESLDKHVSRTGISLLWLWLFLLLLVLGLLWYLDKKYKWLKSLKNHVTEFLS